MGNSSAVAVPGIQDGDLLQIAGERLVKAGSSRRPAFWPANRIAKLRKLWGTLSNAAIARELGISKAAVFRQARQLALPPRRLNAWRPSERWGSGGSSKRASCPALSCSVVSLEGDVPAPPLALGADFNQPQNPRHAFPPGQRQT
jgi:hypothetical protein